MNKKKFQCRDITLWLTKYEEATDILHRKGKPQKGIVKTFRE